MNTTPDVITFSRKTAGVLLVASLLSAAGFLWPFFYVGENLPQTQLFFWCAVAVSFALVVVQISSQQLDATSKTPAVLREKVITSGVVFIAIPQGPQQHL